MSRDVYPRKWGLGPKVSSALYIVLLEHVLDMDQTQALRKKQLIAEGKLGKFGKILEDTPVAIKEEFAIKQEPHE